MSLTALADAAFRASVVSLFAEDAEGSNGGTLRVSITGVVSARVVANVVVRRGVRVPSLDVTAKLSWDATWHAPAGKGAAAGTRLAAGESALTDVSDGDLAEEFPVTVRLTHAPAAATGEVAATVAHAKLLASGPLAELLRKTLRALAAWLVTLDAPEPPATSPDPSPLSTAPAPAPSPPPPARLPLPSPPAAIDPTTTTSSAPSEPSMMLPLPFLKKGVGAAPLAAAAAALSRAASTSAVSLPVGPQRVVLAGEAPEVEASTWNRGGWQWEDKDITPWARSRLKEALVGFDVDVPGAHIAIVDVEELVGEASVTMRKGRKLVLFDLAFVAKWEGELLDVVTGCALGTGDGDIVITDLDQDSFVLSGGVGGAPGHLEVPLRVRASEDGGATDEALSELLRKHGVPLLRARLAAFVADLKAQE